MGVCWNSPTRLLRHLLEGRQARVVLGDRHQNLGERGGTSRPWETTCAARCSQPSCGAALHLRPAQQPPTPLPTSSPGPRWCMPQPCATMLSPSVALRVNTTSSGRGALMKACGSRLEGRAGERASGVAGTAWPTAGSAQREGHAEKHALPPSAPSHAPPPCAARPRTHLWPACCRAGGRRVQRQRIDTVAACKRAVKRRRQRRGRGSAAKLRLHPLPHLSSCSTPCRQ